MAYSKGIITIPNITDDVVITVTTEEIETSVVQPLFDIRNDQNYDSINGYYKFAGNMEGAFGNCYIPYIEGTTYDSTVYEYESGQVKRYTQSKIADNSCTYTADSDGFYVHIANTTNNYTPPRIDTGVCLGDQNSWTIVITTYGWFKNYPLTIPYNDSKQIVSAADHFQKGEFNSLISSDWIQLGDRYYPNFCYQIGDSNASKNKIYQNRISGNKYYQIKDFNTITRLVFVYKNNQISGYVCQDTSNISTLNQTVLGYTSNNDTEFTPLLNTSLDISSSVQNIFIGNNYNSLSKNNAYYGYIKDFKIYDYAFSGYETAMYLTDNTSSLDQVDN